MKVLRNLVGLSTTYFLRLLLLCILAMSLGTGRSTAQSEQRKLKEKEFDRMPVRVLEVRNLQSDAWPNDLEIEVVNVSNQRIYFVDVVLVFPDDPAPNGSSGIVLDYGNTENMDVSRIASAEDEHLDPGKTICLIVTEVYRKGLLRRNEKWPENFKRMELSFGIISFGNGTGFVATEFQDYRRKKK